MAIPAVLFLAIAGGSLGAVVSLLLGYPPYMHLVSYIGGGNAALLAYGLRRVRARARRA